MTFGAVDPASVVGGVLLPEAIQVTTGLALQEVLRRAEALGVRFSWGTEATGIRRDGDRVTGVETTAGVVDAATVVLAAGAWTPALLGTVGRALPLIPTVATRFVSEQAGLSPLMPTIQSLDLGLWLRELRGAFSWGGGFAYRRVSVLEREEGLARAFARPVSPQLIEAQRDYQASVAEVFPALAGLGTAEIIKACPSTPSTAASTSAPSPRATDSGCWRATTGQVTHGPGMGRLVAEMITGTEPFADPEPFRLDRVDPALYPDEASMIAEMAGDRVLKAMR